MLTALRLAAFASLRRMSPFFALPREYDYPHRESRIRLLNVFRLRLPANSYDQGLMLLDVPCQSAPVLLDVIIFLNRRTPASP